MGRSDVQLADTLKELERGVTELLWMEVAAKLSGRPVVVDWRPPALRGCRAMAFKDWRDPERAVFQINPELGDLEKFRSFLHECAHVKCDWSVMTIREEWQEALPQSWRWTNKAAHDKRYDAPKRESRADVQRNEWLAYAQEHAKGETVRDYLLALLSLRG